MKLTHCVRSDLTRCMSSNCYKLGAVRPCQTGCNPASKPGMQRGSTAYMHSCGLYVVKCFRRSQWFLHPANRKKAIR
jgi:hypothetical protein